MTVYVAVRGVPSDGSSIETNVAGASNPFGPVTWTAPLLPATEAALIPLFTPVGSAYRTVNVYLVPPAPLTAGPADAPTGSPGGWASTAPMSAAPLYWRTYPNPRWSVTTPGVT